MGKTKKVCVCGHFGFGRQCLNGQTVKTKTITDELIRNLGSEEVETIDTYGGVKTVFSLAASVPLKLRSCENFIMMPAHNGLRILTPLLLFWNRFFGRRLHYVVIGGWLPAFLQDKERLAEGLRKFDFVYVETRSMKEALEAMGFGNVVVMPNCKKLRILDPEELEYSVIEPLRLCTFSRVMEEKGIGDAVRAVNETNAALGRSAFRLDIYGPVDAGQKEWFERLKRDFGDAVEYRGEVSPEKAPEALKPYFALLFPTRFRTEGIPGTVIDAYAAGVPVLCSDWENRRDIVDDGVTGRVYEFGDYRGLRSLLEEIAADPASLVRLKPICLERARGYGPEAVVGEILIGGGCSPLRVCTFSRVMREKGIEEAIAAVASVNRAYKRAVFHLDIYGPLEGAYRERFAEALANSDGCASYCGAVDPEKSAEILKGYYALLFPTYYEGEGLAGTLIDAMCAGLPVVASDWRCNGELVSSDIGMTVKPKDSDALAEALAEIYENNADWLRRRRKCLRAAENFLPERALAGLMRRIKETGTLDGIENVDY